MPRRLLVRTLLLLALTLGLPTSAFADTVIVKWATLAPEGTTWFRALRQIGNKWQEISGGAVQVKIYADGAVGNETAMVRKMRIGQLHGGQITNIGLVDFDPGPQVIQALARQHAVDRARLTVFLHPLRVAVGAVERGVLFQSREQRIDMLLQVFLVVERAIDVQVRNQLTPGDKREK